MTLPKTPDDVRVEQVDREAAADYGRALFSISPKEADAIRCGNWDDLERVQWFSRHRLSSTRPSDESVEALKALPTVRGCRSERDFVEVPVELRDAILTALSTSNSSVTAQEEGK